MKYQLILQLPESNLKDIDALISLEEDLAEILTENEDVDGHDIGSGEANIFVFTNEPKATFQRVRPTLENAGYLMNVTVAYRDVEGENYIVIWPKNFMKKFTIL